MTMMAEKTTFTFQTKQTMSSCSSTLAPDLSHLVNDRKIKWVFVGGKGGVGKTTTSCSLAIQFARQRLPLGQKVLLISTDPAHNLSDAFQQKILDQPTQIIGVENLYAMETDPSTALNKLDASLEDLPGGAGADANNNPMHVLKDIMKNMPGVDEAMNFNELLNQVKSMEYSVVLFDTAPTGHTLRLLSMPTTLEEGLNKIMSTQSGGLGSMMQAMQSMMGGENGDRLTEAKEKVKQISAIFKDPERTTFVCVCIPEFLSVFETERLVQELAKFEIDCSNIVVNQVLYPENASCGLCTARSKMQSKYLAQIDELYEDFHVVKMPMLHNEVRGVPSLESFSNNLIRQYKPNNNQ